MKTLLRRLLAIKNAVFVRPTVRTTTVWAVLVVAMLTVTGVLSALEPPPIAPGSLQPISSVIPDSGTDAVLFSTLPQVRTGRWNALVIHFSGQGEGTLHTISQKNASQGRIDSGYHFIINNGRGKPDGEIERGFRWSRQYPGEFGKGPNAEWYNTHALGICLVGNPDQTPPTAHQMRELTWLVRQLQERLNIPTEHVVVQSDSPHPFKFFPYNEFRAELTQNPPLWVASNDPAVTLPLEATPVPLRPAANR
jgi:N-acetylmuramoyl-L-alanine amidase